MQFEWNMWLQWVWMTSPTAVWFSKQGWIQIEQSCVDAILTKFFEKRNFKIESFGTVFYIALRIFRWISLNLCYVDHMVMVDLQRKQGWKNTHIVREHVREDVLVLEQEQNKNTKKFWYWEQEQDENRKDLSQEHCS